jgi:hypothetical protein
MYAVWVLDFVFAYVLGIVFQYYAIVPIPELDRVDRRRPAREVRVEVELHEGHEAVHADLPMQLAMVAGFLTSYPVNWWLVSVGIKERM